MNENIIRAYDKTYCKECGVNQIDYQITGIKKGQDGSYHISGNIYCTASNIDGVTEEKLVAWEIENSIGAFGSFTASTGDTIEIRDDVWGGYEVLFDVSINGKLISHR